jgi:UDPglucose--hexose-1-phosphate uridylyltransferase
MPEFRQDPITKQWVIIASERARRPHEFLQKSDPPTIPSFKEDCPFCPGNEKLTPPESMAYRQNGTPNGSGWRVRVIPNKFAALVPEGSLERTEEGGIFRRMDGVGRHEVVIESPDHDKPIALMADRQVEEVVLAYRERYLALREDPRFKSIIIFKNHGIRAGTSLEHPHSQIVGVPVVPLSIRYRYEKAASHFDDVGTCVFCDVMRQNLRMKSRVVRETERFLSFHPFASRAPFETWILPKEHQASFGLMMVDDAREFAAMLKTILRQFYRVLKNPDFNFIIHTAPFKNEQADYYHWHLQILPRLTTPAGFELGTGMFINTAIPEETAAFMRNFPDSASDDEALNSGTVKDDDRSRSK